MEKALKRLGESRRDVWEEFEKLQESVEIFRQNCFEKSLQGY